MKSVIRVLWMTLICIAVISGMVFSQSKSGGKTYTMDQLTDAILSNQQGLVKEIIMSKQIDLNKTNSEGDYPLQVTLVFNNVEMAELLLKNGANPHVKLTNKQSIYDLVMEDGTKVMKKLFMRYKSAPKASSKTSEKSTLRDMDQFTSAILSNEQRTVQKMIQSGKVDVNGVNSEGEHPLEVVLVFGNVEMAELLLKNGANPDLMTNSGQTIRQLVEKHDSKTLKKLFKKY